MNTSPDQEEQRAKPGNILFMHMPKTAGMAFGNVFCFAFERFLPGQSPHDQAWREVLSNDASFFLSGHFQFRHIRDVIARDDVFGLTLLRDPVQQLISHFKWVKAYADPARAEKLDEVGPAIANLAKDLWQTSLDDVEALSEITSRPAGMQLFDNMQTRFLCDGHTGPIEQVHCDQAVRNLRAFGLYFVLEDMQQALVRLEERFGELEELKRINTAKIEEWPNLEDPVVRALYDRLTKFDRILFEKAKVASRQSFF